MYENRSFVPFKQHHLKVCQNVYYKWLAGMEADKEETKL